MRFLPDTRLPSPPPFAGVEFFPRQSALYFSRIDPKALLLAAQSELAGNDPPAFLAMLLALAAGLRRGEIDSLAWHQIDFERALIRVESNGGGRLENERILARRSPSTCASGRCCEDSEAKASGSFVIEAEGGEYGPRVWGASTGRTQVSPA